MKMNTRNFIIIWQTTITFYCLLLQAIMVSNIRNFVNLLFLS